MAKILLAEDDDALRGFLARSLAKQGHTVTPVEDGRQALPMLAPGAFDMLVADIVMPGLDGLELARRASSAVPGIKVMFITGFSAVALRARSIPDMDAKVLSKPFHLRELVDEIHKMLAA
jgi:two-component system, cell cycle response regulator CpdR